MVKKARGKIPRKALEPLLQMCEQLSRESGEPAADIFKEYLELMSKYGDYFFSGPWPREYDYDRATTFNDEDLDFLFEERGEFGERLEVVCLKKNMYLEGFMGYFGIYWTRQAFYERFVRPELKPILEAFKKHAEEGGDARGVLNKMKEQFNKVVLIHAGLIDLLMSEHLERERGMLVAEMLELIHTEEGLPPCNEYRCELQREELRKEQNKNASA